MWCVDTSWDGSVTCRFRVTVTLKLAYDIVFRIIVSAILGPWLSLRPQTSLCAQQILRFYGLDLDCPCYFKQSQNAVKVLSHSGSYQVHNYRYVYNTAYEAGIQHIAEQQKLR